MIVTRAGVDRSASYFPDELASISIVKVGWDGEVGQGTIPVPDPSGNQEPYEGEQLLLEQSSHTIVDGFLGAITSERGPTAGGTRRVHTMTLADDNALLSGHATPGWTRPAEAPADRWAAFVSDFLPGSIDTTWLLTTNESGITLPKKTYRTDDLFADLSADTIGPTGKTVYIEARNFHWHLPTEGQTCSIAIDDGASDRRLRPTNPNRQKDGMDLRNELYARNDAGVVVGPISDSTSITRHNSGGLVHQGYSEYGSETSAEMTRDLNVTLLERKQERITWTYVIGPLTAAQAAALIPGSQMTVTAAVHSLSAAVKRIARVTLAYRNGGTFMATVELGYPRRVKRKPTKTTSASDSTGGSGVSTSGCTGCPPWTCIPTDFTVFNNLSLPELFVTEVTGGGDDQSSISNAPPTYVHLYEGATYKLTYTAHWGPTADQQSNYIAYSGGPPIGIVNMGRQFTAPPAMTPTASTTVTIPGTFTNDYYLHAAQSGTVGHVADGSEASVIVTFISGPDPRFVDLPLCTNGEPDSGQPAHDTPFIGDGTTTSFTTSRPYMAGTLEVEVNGRDWAAQITETDPSTGAYTLAYPIPAGATVRVKYRAA